MTSRYASAMEFGRPRSPELQDSRAAEAVRRYAHGRNLERTLATLVTDHGQPHREPYDRDVVTAGARALHDAARAAGWPKVQIVERADLCVVEGIDPAAGVAFRGVWVRGRAGLQTWHTRDYRYTLAEDTRPEPKRNAKTLTSLAGCRPVGVDRVHLTITDSPVGRKMTVAALLARVKAGTRG